MVSAAEKLRATGYRFTVQQMLAIDIPQEECTIWLLFIHVKSIE